MKEFIEKIKQNSFVKMVSKNQRLIIEGAVVSAVFAYALSNILRRSFLSIESINEAVANTNFVTAYILLAVCFISGCILYAYWRTFTKILMFASVLVYAVLSVIFAEGLMFSNFAKNEIGKACFAGIWCFIAVLAFLYVKNDIFKVLEKLNLSKMAMWIIIGVIGVAIVIFVGGVGVYRYLSYANSTFDMGIFAQMYEHMRKTFMMNTTVERSYLLSHLGVHFSPIFYLGLPIYMLCPSAATVQVIQAIMIALPVIPIALLGKHFKLNNRIIVLLTLIYALFPATAQGTFYDMHENCFLTFVLLMLFWAVEKRKNIWMIIMIILVFMTKEDAGIYMTIFGTYMLFSRRDKIRGVILMISGGVTMVVGMAIVKSFGLGVLDDRLGNLMFGSGGLFKIVQTFIANPAFVVGQMITNADAGKFDKIEFYILFFVPMAALIFTTGRKYTKYILLLPIIVLNLATTYPYLHDIGFQYNYGPIALIMYLALLNLADMPMRKRKTMTGVALICCTIFFFAFPFMKLPSYVKSYNASRQTTKTLDEVIDQVPTDASVLTTGWIMPHLSKNLYVYDAGHINDAENHYKNPNYCDNCGVFDKNGITENTMHTNKCPKNPDYLVYDARSAEDYQYFKPFVESGKYDLVVDKPNLIQVYKRK